MQEAPGAGARATGGPADGLPYHHPSAALGLRPRLGRLHADVTRGGLFARLQGA